MSQPPASWKNLFERPASSGSVRVPVWVLKRAGEPLLILPTAGRGVEATLTLYPAQTTRARLARAIWHYALPWGMAPGAVRDSVGVDPADPLVTFLNSMTGTTGGEPRFAVLAGNPRVPGRRFLILGFDSHWQPVTVVKAAVDTAGAKLIEREAAFLAGAPRGSVFPEFRGRFQNGNITAFAMRYVAGDSPAAAQGGRLVTILNEWLGQDRCRVAEIEGWKRLRAASGGQALFARIAGLEDLTVRPALVNGDLAPWNIKVSRRDASWTVLDWERVEQQGMPAWDWFHFVLQPAILVRREPVPRLARLADALLASSDFRAYAQKAGLAGHERECFLAYLLHCRDVLRPAEGSPPTKHLLEHLAKQWVES